MAKAFASQGDLGEKQEKFIKLADNAYCLTAEGDPNTGVIVGDDAVMVIDTRATPAMAADVIRHVEGVTDKPIKYLLLTHYHAVRVMGAAGYKDADTIIASEGTLELIKERGQQDFDSEVQRFPRLFRSVETVPGLTWPNLVFDRSLTLWLGRTEVQIKHIGKGHSKGDTIAWLPKERVMFSGDLVEEGATPYCGDAYFTEWPDTLDRLRGFRAEKLVPGRGDAMMDAAAAERAIAGTADFLRDMRRSVEAGVKAGKGLKAVFAETHRSMQPKYGQWVIFEHCLPFDIARCFDEMSGIKDPRIWTAERDIEMWKTLQD
jgi:glyoxylase-like metal-dependent hydrolase (beta-lactamase superfamily II)